jgi:hypothetical protein
MTQCHVEQDNCCWNYSPSATMSGTVLNTGYCVSLNMVWYTVEQHAFLYESYVKHDLLERVRKNSVVNFPETQFQGQEASLNLRKSGTTEPLLD